MRHFGSLAMAAAWLGAGAFERPTKTRGVNDPPRDHDSHVLARFVHLRRVAREAERQVEEAAKRERDAPYIAAAAAKRARKQAKRLAVPAVDAEGEAP